MSACACMLMHVCVRVCVCKSASACACTRVHACMCVWACACTCACACTLVCACACLGVCVRVCARAARRDRGRSGSGGTFWMFLVRWVVFLTERNVSETRGDKETCDVGQTLRSSYCLTTGAASIPFLNVCLHKSILSFWSCYIFWKSNGTRGKRSARPSAARQATPTSTVFHF